MLVAAFLVPAIIAVFVRVRIASAERRRRFAERELVSGDEWFARYFPDAKAGAPALIEILEKLGKDIGIEWGRLRPEDMFSGTLGLKEGAPGRGEEFDEFFWVLEQWAQKHGIQPQDLGINECDRLIDFLRALDGALGAAHRAQAAR
jgi:hypothetical protein